MLNFSHSTLMVIITVIISLMAWQNVRLYNRLIFFPPMIKKGQVDRFLTHGFIHADGTHLLFNMIALYSFGRSTEIFLNQYVNGFGFIIFYLFAIIAASIPDYIKYKDYNGFRSLGASGGVLAIIFVTILLDPWHKIFLLFIPMPAIIFAIGFFAYSIYAHFTGFRIFRNANPVNHSAHLWGAAFGIVASIAINPNLLLHFVSMLSQPRF